MSKAIRLGGYGASFVAARGLLFASPLILASLLPAHAYGAFEWGHATATLLATIIALGAGSVVPLAIHGRAPGVEPGSIVFHFLVIAAMWAGGAVIVLPFLSDLAARTVALLTPIILLQTYFSVRLKSTGRAEASLWLDAGLFIVATGASVGAYFAAPTLTISVAIAALGVYGVFLLGAATYQTIESRRAGAGMDWIRLIRLGLPLMAAALAATLVTTSGRFGVGLFFSLETTAVYSALFRGTAIPVIGHQFIMTALFSRAYSVDDSRLDRTLFIIPLGVGGFALGFWTVSPWLAPLLGPAFESAFTEHRWTAAVLLTQTLLWSGVSLNDLASARQQVAHKILPFAFLTLLFLMCLGVLAFLLGSRSLESYVIIHFLMTGAYFSTQAALLRRNGVRLPYLWMAYGAAVVTLLGIFHLSL